MIVKNEEDLFDRCIKSAKPYVDEIIITDTGSTDKARKVMKSHTDRIYDFEWCDDFAAAYNYSISKATGDWILILDSDEVVSPEDMRKIRAITEDPNCDAYFLQQKNYPAMIPQSMNARQVALGDTWARNYKTYEINPMIRLFRNRPDIKFHGRIHSIIDHTDPDIRIKRTQAEIHNYGDESPERPAMEKLTHYLGILEEELATKPSARLYYLAAGTRFTLDKADPKAQEHLQLFKSKYRGETVKSIMLMEDLKRLEWAVVDDPFRMPAIDQLPVRRYGTQHK
jgi:glycosyltransferase involved in cell wall biosynthesis